MLGGTVISRRRRWWRRGSRIVDAVHRRSAFKFGNIFLGEFLRALVALLAAAEQSAQGAERSAERLAQAVAVFLRLFCGTVRRVQIQSYRTKRGPTRDTYGQQQDQ